MASDIISRSSLAECTIADLELFLQIARILQDRGACTRSDLVGELQELDIDTNEDKLGRFLHGLEERTQPAKSNSKRGKSTDDKAGTYALFLWAYGKGIRGLTARGQTLVRVARDILDQIQKIETRASQLRLAASDAVSTYLFPEILADMQSGESNDPLPMTGLFRPSMLEYGGDIASGKIDLAVAWNAYRQVRSEDVQEQHLRKSSTQPCMIFHPLHPFGLWYLKRLEAGQRPEGKALLAEIRKHTVVFPGALEKLSKNLDKLQIRDKKIAVESFSAVVTHVRMRVGLGLFPGWPWLLDQLRRDEHIQSLDLPWPNEESLMSLSCYRSASLKNPLVDDFIERLELKLEELASWQSTEEHWTREDWTPSLLDPTGDAFLQDWHAYYINRSASGMPLPHWYRGDFHFSRAKPARKSPKEDTQKPSMNRIEGTYILSGRRQSVAKNVYHLTGDFGPDYLRLISTPDPSIESIKDDPPAFLVFTTLLSRKSVTRREKDLMLLGLIYVLRKDSASRGLPTVAPFLLCPKSVQLAARDFRQIANFIECHTDGEVDPKLLSPN